MSQLSITDNLTGFNLSKGRVSYMISAQLPVKELKKRNIKGMNKPLDLDKFLQTYRMFLGLNS